MAKDGLETEGSVVVTIRPSTLFVDRSDNSMASILEELIGSE